ncbi:MAG: hypothetical protein AAB817_01225, partial [Patescibacteria group bacterium]
MSNLRRYNYWLLGLFGLEALSLLAYFVPSARPVIFVMVIIGVVKLAWRSFDWLVLIAVAELFVGSKGYLLFLDAQGFNISLRLGLFLIIMAAWAIRYLWRCEVPALWTSKWRNAYLALAAVIIWGAVWGLIRGNGLSAVFFDVNGWLYFAYALPFYEVIKRRQNQLLPL